jgi:crotonobetainyl-CoA:carnitine CoA-transferase CaiB-like acyl-CoA transferase
LGAHIVKVEQPAGDALRQKRPLASDGQAHAFHLVAAGKRSVALTGQDTVDRNSITKLLLWTDAVVADETGVAYLRSLGLDIDALLNQWPHIILCPVTPFGLTGPLRDWVAGEFTLQAMSGVMACTGYPNRAPLRTGVAVGAHIAGLLSATAVLAALRARQRSGRGQLADMAIHDCLVACLGSFLPMYFLTGASPSRQGNRHPMGAPWNAYPCRDGWVVICAFSPHQWAPLLRVMGREDIIGDPRFGTMVSRVAHVDAVDTIVASWTQTQTIAQVIAALEDAKVPAGPVVGMAELLENPHFRARHMLLQVPSTDSRSLSTVGPLCKMSLTPGRLERAAPSLGEATAEILRAAASARVRNNADSSITIRKPLEGVRILEMGAFTAVPVATRLLACLGAEVTKIEPPAGEAARHLAQRVGEDGYLYHLNNTDKRSATLDVATADGRLRFLELARRSDVFIENFAPATTVAWGIGPQEVMALNPRLLYCSVSGFGHQGPLRDKRAFDSVIQAMAGVLALTGEPADPPVKSGLSVADLLGACLATVVIVAGLLYRDRTGRGQHLDVSMHDAAGWLTAELWPPLIAGLDEPQRLGNRHIAHAPHDVFYGSDGQAVVVEVRDDAEWARLLVAMERDDLISDPRYATALARQERIDDVRDLVAKWVAARAGADAVQACQASEVAAGPVMSLAEVVEHPHTRAREMVITLEHQEHGPIRLLGCPLKLTRPRSAVTRPAPRLGEHNTEIWSALSGSGHCEGARQASLRIAK